MTAGVKQVLRPAQASERMGVSLSTFWRLVRRDPAFPRPFKLGGPSSRTTVVDADALSAWLTECRNASSQLHQ
jgi:predicted DNA-binding transcriptional regulator AlpA